MSFPRSSAVPLMLGIALGATGLLPGCGGDDASSPPPPPSFVGSGACAGCHARETALWRGSDHDLAMEPATDATVLGDFEDATFDYGDVTTTFFRRDGKFLVRTDDENGDLREYEIDYTFGHRPLQQYLVRFPGGRYQALTIVWDSRPAGEGGQRWYHLYPDGSATAGDILHWTGVFQNWNVMCADCHSTNLVKAYDPVTDSYATTWSEIDVSCEACHGPGSLHVEQAEEAARSGHSAEAGGGLTVLLKEPPAVWLPDSTTGIAHREPPRSGDRTLEICAPCHSRRTALRDPYPVGAVPTDAQRLALLTDDLYFPDGQVEEEVYVYGSFLQSRMHAAGVTCTDCHDPHSLRLVAEGNALCGRCHLPDRFDVPAHTGHEAGTPGAACVECHMPERTYMGVDARRDHSFRIPRPDLTEELGVPNACNGCHTNRSAAWARERIRDRHGPDAARRPTFARALAAAAENAPGAADSLRRVATDPELPGIVRATALSLLRLHPSRETARALAGAVGDPDPLVRAGAAEGLEGLPPELRNPLALPLLDDPRLSVRIEATEALAGAPLETLSPADMLRFRATAAETRASLERNADRPEALLRLGLFETQLGRLGPAEEAYRRAIGIAPGFLASYVNLADLYRLQDREEEAEAVLVEALARDPGNPEIEHALGLTLARRRRLEEALPYLRRSAEGRPESARFAYVYGIALNSSGRGEEAIEVLEKAEERHPDDADILFALATLERDRGNLPAARRHAERLVDVRPEDAQARALLEMLSGN